MAEYFKPWRRRIGLLTLGMSCMFTAGWVRSLCSREFIFIDFEIPIGGRIHVYTSASQMDILIQRSTGWHFDFGEVDPIVGLNAFDDVWFFNVRQIEEEIVDGVLQVAPGYEVRLYFYAIVIPLTLISLWLLLSKPKGSNQEKITEPVPEKAT
jgi:hypothetical protein